MGLLDLLTVVVAVVGYTIGRGRGLVFQLSGVLTLVMGGLSATILSSPLGPLFADGILGRFVAWVVVYAVVGVCLYVLTLKLKDKIKEMEFEELDKRFGGMLGAFKGLCVFGLILMVAVALSDTLGDAVKDSATGQSMAYLVHEARPLVPDKIHDAFERIRPGDDAVAGPVPTKPTEPTTPPQPTPTRPVQPPPRDPAQQQPLGPPQPVERPNPFATADPEDPLGMVPEVHPLEPSGAINDSRDVEPIDPDEDDPFDTSDDPDDPLAPRRD